jgi:hypothetical protein
MTDQNASAKIAFYATIAATGNACDGQKIATVKVPWNLEQALKEAGFVGAGKPVRPSKRASLNSNRILASATFVVPPGVELEAGSRVIVGFNPERPTQVMLDLAPPPPARSPRGRGAFVPMPTGDQLSAAQFYRAPGP